MKISDKYKNPTRLGGIFVCGGARDSLLNFAKHPIGFICYVLQNSSVTVQKQRTVLFFHCVRFPSSYFRAKLKERDKNLSFNFGGLEGNSLLNFARQRAKVVKLCLAKSFGHRSKTVHWTVFSLRSIPLILFSGKIKREG